MTVRRFLGFLRWYLRELTGEAEYDRHVERHRRTRPGTPVPTRREYERLRRDRQETGPSTRCC